VRRLLDKHRSFVIALILAVGVRGLVQLAFPPAFVFSDGPTNLSLVDSFTPSTSRTVGYGVLLGALAELTRAVWLVSVTQHLLGLLTAVLLYLLMRRWGVSAGLATAATVPVLFDGMQLVLEHAVLTDVLFNFVVVCAVAVLAWSRRPGVGAAALAGLLLGAAVLVRVTGVPMVVAGVVFCLLAATTLRARVGTALALALTFVVPLVAYASWYHQEQGKWALTEAGGRALYMRTTTFVDCSRLEVPTYQERLCPSEPLGQRRDPTFYGWHDADGILALDPPPGTTPDEAQREFALAAIAAQPGDYATVVVRDFMSAFFPMRTDLFEYETSYKWHFKQYIGYVSTDWTRPAYAAHGGQQPYARQPFANLMGVYGSVVYLWGPLVLALLVIALTGLVKRVPPDRPDTRPLVFLLTALGVGLVLVPDLTAQFTWRYQLPAIVLLPVAAALAWTRIRRPVSLRPERVRGPWPPRGRTGRTEAPPGAPGPA
jgi:hypothetical protein